MQPPQFCESRDRSTQAPEQLVVPGGQLLLQAPFPQTSPGAQASPQLPQFFGSLTTSTQAPLHRVLPASHTQVPLVQLWRAPQATPHEPQFFGSLARSTQLPPQADALP